MMNGNKYSIQIVDYKKIFKKTLKKGVIGDNFGDLLVAENRCQK